MTVEQINPQVIEKAEVTIPAPGMRISAIKRNPNRGVDMPNGEKRQMAGIYVEMYRKHPWIRASIDKISKTAASPGINFVPFDPTEDYITLHKDNLVKFFRASHIKKLLRTTYKDLLIFGEAFWLIDVTLGGRPVNAMRLHPRYMDAVVDDVELVQWRYGPFHHDENAIFYDKEVVLHFAIEDPDSDLVGLSPLHSLQETVTQDLFAMRYNRSFFENSAQTGTVFNMQNATKEEVDRNRAWLEENYVSVINAHRPIILEGDITVSSSVSKHQEMEFSELRRINREEIFGVLDMDPTKAGITRDANDAIAENATDSFHEETIAPLQAVVEEEINDRLILDLFGYDDILFAHEESSPRQRFVRMTYYRDAVRDGLFVRNEVRAELGKKPIEGGDVPTISTSAGVVPLERLLEEPDPALSLNPLDQQAPIVRPRDQEADGTPGVNPNEEPR